MNFAVSALEYPPVGARMTQVASPLHQGTVRLDHSERMCAGCCDGHCERVFDSNVWNFQIGLASSEIDDGEDELEDW
ncbi:hypothetical protein GGR50DRAFT_289803 [Xylaria sp. CBS 124048]|nr:hypothetical protein GGR50DRAFT_289803 [Xylaria sp. CBS 124048]